MIRLLVLCALLGWAGMAGAAEPPVEYPFISDIFSGGQHHPEVSKDGKTWEPLPCLAQMEAAMRSMAPYLPYVHNGKVLDPVELSKVVKQLFDAGEQWESTKRACWKEKP